MARKKNERAIRQAYYDERKQKQGLASKTSENVENASTSSSSNNENCNGRRRKGQRNNLDKDCYLDQNDQHFLSFKNQLTSMGLMIRDINGDGNCLFRALNDQMEGHSRNHMQYRGEIVRYMLENRADFEPFVEDEVPFDKYTTNLGKDGTFGGQDVLVAFARLRNVNIVIHQLNQPLWHIDGGSKQGVEVHLSYHNGEHYSSVRRLGDNSENAANVKLSLVNSINKKPEKSSFVVEDTFESFDDLDTKVDQIMQISGCKDVNMIEEALSDVNYNLNEALNVVTSLMLMSCVDQDSIPICDTTTTTKDEQRQQNCQDALPRSGDEGQESSRVLLLDENVVVGKSSPLLTVQNQVESKYQGGGAKPKTVINTIQTKKHLSNKERKDLKRRERQSRKQQDNKGGTTRTRNQEEEEEDFVLATNLSCLNI